METNTNEYKEHLEKKYLPGRDKYLRWFFYPKILRQFNSGEVIDLGFGTGEFLRYLRSKNVPCKGIDSNPFLTQMLKSEGFDVELDDITVLNTVNKPILNAISDNVLEHLSQEQIELVFSALSKKMAPGGVFVIIVPLEKGYQRDPTHKTFVNHDLVKRMATRYKASLLNHFDHPINLKGVGRFFYLNMQVYVLRF